MLNKIKENVITAIVSAAIVAVGLSIWGVVSGGGLVRFVGGATAAKLTEANEKLTGLAELQNKTAGALTVVNGKVVQLEKQIEEANQVPLTVIPVKDAEPIRKWFGNAGGWGRWSPVLYCAKDHYVCGLRQRVERALGGNEDDTAMNAVEFYCCPFPKLAKKQ